MPLFYISFAGDDGFRGATVVGAENEGAACDEARKRGINPGGQAVIIKIPDEEETNPEVMSMLNRLIGKKELIDAGGKTLEELEHEADS